MVDCFNGFTINGNHGLMLNAASQDSDRGGGVECEGRTTFLPFDWICLKIIAYKITGLGLLNNFCKELISYARTIFLIIG